MVQEYSCIGQGYIGAHGHWERLEGKETNRDEQWKEEYPLKDEQHPQGHWTRALITPEVHASGVASYAVAAQSSMVACFADADRIVLVTTLTRFAVRALQIHTGIGIGTPITFLRRSVTTPIADHMLFTARAITWLRHETVPVESSGTGNTLQSLCVLLTWHTTPRCHVELPWLNNLWNIIAVILQVRYFELH